MRKDPQTNPSDAAGDHAKQLRAIERKVAVDSANIELAALSSFRLWILVIFAGLLGLGTLFVGNDAPSLSEVLRLLAILAAASAVFHFLTWAILRGTIWLRDRRSE